MTCRIKKTKSKRASQPRATIRSGTTAQTKHNTIRASVNRSTNQQSGAERGSRQRIAVGGETRSSPLAEVNSTTAV